MPEGMSDAWNDQICDKWLVMYDETNWNIWLTDLSIKLEVGRDEELGVGGMTGKQRSFSMDLSPSDGPPFGSMPGPSAVWSLPSPSSAQHITTHDLSLENAQSTADGMAQYHTTKNGTDIEQVSESERHFLSCFTHTHFY